MVVPIYIPTRKCRKVPSNEISEIIIRKHFYSPLHQKVKYLGINLPKKAKDLYSKNYKILMKEIEYDTNRWINSVLGLEESIL